MSNEAEFYDDIYRKNPGKWGIDPLRDAVAFFVMSQAGVNNPARLLDYGCGNGHTIVYLKSKWENTEYCGVDISEVAREIAAQRAPDAEYFEEMPDETYDVITVMGVAEHFPDVAAGLRVLGEHLTPGGALYLEAPNCLAYSQDKTEGFRQTYHGSGQMEWHWTWASWEKAIQAAGFKIVRSYDGVVPAWGFIWLLRKE